MKRIRLASLVATWTWLVASAIATGAAAPPGGPVETTPTHHQPRRTGPLIVNWRFKSAPGLVNLIVNPDGTYLFSGNYRGRPPFEPESSITHDFSVMLALKSTLGGVILFQYTGLDNGNVQWSKQGQSGILKDEFKTFGDWTGTWRVSLTPSGSRSLSAYCNALESTFGNEWVNNQGQVMFGWSPGEYALWRGYHC